MSAATATPATDAIAERDAATKPAKPTSYTLGVNRATIRRMCEWAANDSPDGDGELGRLLEAFPDPALIDDADVVMVGNAAGHTRKQAVEDNYLDSPATGGDRHAWLKRADDAGVRLAFVVVPTGYIGEHVVESEVVTSKRRK